MAIKSDIKFILLGLCLLLSILSACRKEEGVLSSNVTVIGGYKKGDIKGFFLLNEGNMGSNKASLDYFNYDYGIFYKNIYPERNPGVVKELGDVGNDLQIYGDKLYAVINCSHFVEVMDVQTAKHITQISIPNCRYITFHKGFAYVSSFAGPVQIDPNARLGYVAKIDTASMKVVDECVVGYQPEELAVVGDKLYVANSGGYRAPHYDNTLSVIDLNTFTEIKKLEVAINLHRVKADKYGNLYVSSRGNHKDIPSKTFIIDTKTDEVKKEIPSLSASEMTIGGDSLYVTSTEWNQSTGSNTVSYAIYDIRQQKIVSRNFIKDGTEQRIAVPYGIAVNVEQYEFFVTDAGNYVTPGKLYCYSLDGILKWSVTTGDIPAHIAFTNKRLKAVDDTNK